MKILFLSHCPHDVHLEFAKSVGAEIKIIHLNWLVKLIKKIKIIGFFYPIYSFIYSFFIGESDIFLVDGGSSLYTVSFIKKFHPSKKIIYLDGDILFYNLSMQKKIIQKIQTFFFKEIDAVISVSGQNKKNISRFLKVPIEVAPPYPGFVEKINIKRKDYGLYVGRLDPDKDIKRIVQFGLQCPYFKKFIIAGDGVFKNYIKKIAKKNKKIIYLGQRKDIEKIYSNCKFLIHIPDYDPHPCTTMESALCGCFPIISKKIGTNYLFDETFIAENPDDFKEINNKIKYILKNEKMASESLKKSVMKFPTKEKAIKNFKNSFIKLIKN